MSDSAHQCAVCARVRFRGSYDLDLDIFICADCERGAKQFIEIQDSIWGGQSGGEGASK